MRADVDGEARKVPCPKCGARVGENCKSYPGSGGYASIVHRERVRTAEEAADNSMAADAEQRFDADGRPVIDDD